MDFLLQKVETLQPSSIQDFNFLFKNIPSEVTAAIDKHDIRHFEKRHYF